MSLRRSTLPITGMTCVNCAAGILQPFDGIPAFLRQLHPIRPALAVAFSRISGATNRLRLYRAFIKNSHKISSNDLQKQSQEHLLSSMVAFCRMKKRKHSNN